MKNIFKILSNYIKAIEESNQFTLKDISKIQTIPFLADKGVVCIDVSAFDNIDKVIKLLNVNKRSKNIIVIALVDNKTEDLSELAKHVDGIVEKQGIKDTMLSAIYPLLKLILDPKYEDAIEEIEGAIPLDEFKEKYDLK